MPLEIHTQLFFKLICSASKNLIAKYIGNSPYLTLAVQSKKREKPDERVALYLCDIKYSFFFSNSRS